MAELAPIEASVLLPAHDAERTVRAAAESVLRQNDVAFELIAVDDGSTDGTREVLASLADPRVVVVSGAYGGVAAARNRGIAQARGAIVAFIDADDVWLPGTLRAHLDTLARVPAAAVAYGWVDHVDEAGRRLCPDRRVTLEGDVYRDVLTHNFIDCISAVAVRKAALDAVGGFDEALPMVEDWDLYVRLAARHPYACTPRVLVHYRRGAGSLTTHTLTMETAYRRAAARAFAAAPASLAHLEATNLALFYEYLATKTSQGAASRANALLALRFFATAVRARPANLLTLWRRPWVVRGVATAGAWLLASGAGNGARPPSA